MTTATISVAPDHTSDATFRAWGQAFSSALQGLFTKVAQSSDINWATVLKPSAGNTAMGSEVYRFSDSLQGTYPIFFKIEYGSSGSAASPSLWITVGKGADGAGNITNILLPRQQAIYLNSGSTTAYNSYIGNGDGSMLVLSAWPTSPGVSWQGSYLVVERSRDTSGNATGVGVFYQYSGPLSSSDYSASADYSSAQRNTLPYGCVTIPYALDTNISLSNGATSPVFTGAVMTPGRNSWVPTALLGSCQQDFGVATTAAAAMNSVNYLALGVASQYSDVAKQQYASVLLRWD